MSTIQYSSIVELFSEVKQETRTFLKFHFYFMFLLFLRSIPSLNARFSLFYPHIKQAAASLF